MRAAAIVALWVALSHPNPSSLDSARFKAVAEGIVSAAHAAPLREGEDRTAILLAAIAEHEGHLREDVRRCSVTGDDDQAVTLYQLHPGALGATTREAACADDSLAARAALATIRAGLRFCHGSIRCSIHLYASGKDKHTRAAEEIETLWRLSLRPSPRKPKAILLSPTRRR